MATNNSTNSPNTSKVVLVNNAASPYTVLNTDNYLGCQTSSGVITINLPNAPPAGKILIIKDSNGSAATNNITITTVGGTVTIDGATTVTMLTNYQSINVFFDGSNYSIV
jgi:hypothetical protein